MDTFTSMTLVNNIFFLVPSQRSTEFKTHIAYTKKKKSQMLTQSNHSLQTRTIFLQNLGLHVKSKR